MRAERNYAAEYQRRKARKIEAAGKPKRNYAAEYKARDAKYRAKGFTGYSEAQQGKRLGYLTPAQIQGAKKLAKALGVPVAPVTVAVRSVGGSAYVAASGVEVPGRNAGQDVGAALAEQIRAGNTDDRISVPGMKGRGFTSRFVLEWLEENEYDWDAFMAEFDY